MIRFELTYVDLIDKGNFGPSLLRGMKEAHGTACCRFLVPLIGDGDFTGHGLLNIFRLTTLIKATYEARASRFVVDEGFLRSLKKRCFWELNRNQLLRLKNEILTLWPEDFDFLERWSKNDEVLA
jgi:hypothetical protein